MSFAELPFLLFLPVVYAAYWAVPARRAQNLVILTASLFFYGWWDWRFLGLIGASALLDYWVGLRLGLERRPRWRRRLLGVSLLFNLGALALFKYFDFFVGSFEDAFASVGIQLSGPALDLVLPLGISFYTFQTLSYSIDVYRRQLTPISDPVQFGAFVTFFPQLVAGPIERASRLLPQFGQKRRFDWDAATNGCRQALWGFFKKMVVADNAARVVDMAYADPSSVGPWLLLYATLLFAVQIYCDFSGYSDIAIGIGRLFGMSLSTNFRYPYFSRSIPEFWRRWHISLSSWFRDYVYLPLGGNRVSRARWVRNVWVVFLVSGLWHGANWTFVVWGAIHAVFFFVFRDRLSAQRGEPSLRDVPRILGTCAVVCLAWVFFRASSVGDAWLVLEAISMAPFTGSFQLPPLLPFALAAIVVACEWIQRREPHVLAVHRLPTVVRWGIYYLLAASILMLARTGSHSFIYFQF